MVQEIPHYLRGAGLTVFSSVGLVVDRQQYYWRTVPLMIIIRENESRLKSISTNVRHIWFCWMQLPVMITCLCPYCNTFGIPCIVLNEAQSIQQERGTNDTLFDHPYLFCQNKTDGMILHSSSQEESFSLSKTVTCIIAAATTKLLLLLVVMG